MLGLRDGNIFGTYPSSDRYQDAKMATGCNVIYEEPGFGKFNGRIGI